MGLLTVPLSVAKQRKKWLQKNKKSVAKCARYDKIETYILKKGQYGTKIIIRFKKAMPTLPDK